MIAQYVETYLPRLAAPGSRALFPGAGGGSKSMGMLRGQITKAVFRHVGIRMHPHLFRHFAAKLALDRNPGGHGAVTQVLGHRSGDTALAYYIGFENTAAARHFAAMVLSLRHGKTGDGS